MVKIKEPNFMCIGATKSATTSLFDILKQHSEIGIPSFKEPHFFDNKDNFNQGKEWYLKNYFKDLSDKKSIGEFTPTYLSSNHAPERIFRLFGGNMKFIVILRNPVDRAYSHFLHSKRDEYESLDFSDALRMEKERLSDKKDYMSFLRYSYVYQGKYSIHISNYLDYFDYNQFHFVLFDNFINNRKNIINGILDFIGVSKEKSLNTNIFSNQSSVARSRRLKSFLKKDSFLKQCAKFLLPSLVYRQRIRNLIHASNNKPKEKQPLLKHLRKEIYLEFFKKDIFELEKMLNLNLNHWKEC